MGNLARKSASAWILGHEAQVVGVVDDRSRTGRRGGFINARFAVDTAPDGWKRTQMRTSRRLRAPRILVALLAGISLLLATPPSALAREKDKNLWTQWWEGATNR
jgi:ABC-type Fe3+-siderophore transport system permease subunit